MNEAAMNSLLSLLLVALALSVVTAAPYPENAVSGPKSPRLEPQPAPSLAGYWTKSDRAVAELYTILFVQTSQFVYQGIYQDGPLQGHTTFNVTMVADGYSGTGFYANFADNMQSFCPAPFGLVLTADTNVVYVSYGQVFADSECGKFAGAYGGDSAVYYRNLYPPPPKKGPGVVEVEDQQRHHLRKAVPASTTAAP